MEDVLCCNVLNVSILNTCEKVIKAFNFKAENIKMKMKLMNNALKLESIKHGFIVN